MKTIISVLLGIISCILFWLHFNTAAAVIGLISTWPFVIITSRSALMVALYIGYIALMAYLFVPSHYILIIWLGIGAGISSATFLILSLIFAFAVKWYGRYAAHKDL